MVSTATKHLLCNVTMTGITTSSQRLVEKKFLMEGSLASFKMWSRNSKSPLRAAKPGATNRLHSSECSDRKNATRACWAPSRALYQPKYTYAPSLVKNYTNSTFPTFADSSKAWSAFLLSTGREQSEELIGCTRLRHKREHSWLLLLKKSESAFSAFSGRVGHIFSGRMCLLSQRISACFSCAQMSRRSRTNVTFSHLFQK